MSPLKFEENLKDKLDNREISPSSDSWQELAGILDNSKNRNNNQSFRKWYLVAASVVGFVIATSVVYNNIELPQRTDQNIVDLEEQDTKIGIDQEIRNMEELELVRNSKANSVVVVEESKEIQNLVHETKMSSDNNIKDILEKNRTHYTATSQRNKTNTTTMIAQVDQETPAVNSDKESRIIEVKIADVVHQVEELKRKNATVTDKEIEELIEKAQREIATEKILNTKKVDPMVLLSEIESDLDETFKERVFEALKTGFQKVKTAVAERNN